MGLELPVNHNAKSLPSKYLQHKSTTETLKKVRETPYFQSCSGVFNVKFDKYLLGNKYN